MPSEGSVLSKTTAMLSHLQASLTKVSCKKATSREIFLEILRFPASAWK